MVRLAAWLTCLASLGILASGALDSRARETSALLRPPGAAAATAGSSVQGSSARCPDPAQLWDDGVCIQPASDDQDDGPELAQVENQHRDRSGAWKRYDQIPRRPDRPASYEAYLYPIPPGLPGGHYVVSGYDLDKPDSVQRRGRGLKHVGHGGLDLPQQRGTPIKLLALEHQNGDAEVLFVGDLFGHSVVTLHTLRESDHERQYLMLYGHLDHAAPGLVRGSHLVPGTVLGAVGDSGSPELVHLHLEVRRAREGVDLRKVLSEAGPGNLVSDAISVVCDPRNVLPLAPPP